MTKVMEMKFGIITLVSDNYGNKYQNYAVEQLLSQYGEVETFGLENLYQAPKQTLKSKISKLRPSYIREVFISRPMYKYDINCVDKGVIYNNIYARKHELELVRLQKLRNEKFQTFSDNNLNISERRLNRENTTKEWADSYDYFICGSDQIWNPSYATTSELAFCTFAPEKTICLSPSFGVSEIPHYRKNEYSKWLKNIKSLSVREYSGKKIIKELTGRDAEVLLDPTMAIPIEKWNQLCKKPKAQLPPKYIVCYFLGIIDKDYRKQINVFSKKTGLPVVMLFDITTPKYYAFDPAEVLYTIKNADYVLTDSFHGSVFSILFHKNFYVFGRNEGGASMNSRLETLLDTFHLQDRMNLYELDEISGDRWSFADNVIGKEKFRMKNYIERALQGENTVKTCTEKPMPKVYSGYLKDNKKLLKSASGGASTALAEAIIRHGGCVFGAAYSADFKGVEYICCDTIKDLERIKGSKYCATKKNYGMVAEKLCENRPVLFTGLGCDVAGVLAYCESKGINTEKLYTIDILCHGPVSALAYKRFIDDLENKYKSKITEFTCRSKKYGWSSDSILKAKFENGKVLETHFDDTDYGYVFTHYAMPQCEKCHFKGLQHKGDVCVGDYWGIKADDIGWNKNGVSIIAVQSKKGQKLLEMLGEEFVIRETDANHAFEYNSMYWHTRRSLGNYKELQSELMKGSLNKILRGIPEYKYWKWKNKEIRVKSAVLNVIRS
jgi:hypothetical protein